MTTPYATIGRHLPHSYSAIIHRKFAKYDFSLIELEPDEAADFMRHGDYKGITITIPYKKLALELCDDASDIARRIGCANTLVRRKDGSLYAHNTDYDGFKYMAAAAGIDFTGAKVLILGTGGTSLTTRTVVADAHAREIVIVSRTGAVNYSNIYDLHSDADIIINATPVGMFPETNACLLDLSRFTKLKAVVDVIYNPMRTRLNLQAEQMQLPHCDALKMLVAQAFFAMELFLDEKQPPSLIDEVTASIRAETANITLIGMPGSGKSTIGNILAAKTGRKFIDIDSCIVQETGMEIADIFGRYGEGVFRQIEQKCIERFSKQSELIIATGGGAVLSMENRLNLRQNSVVFMLDRPLECLQLGNGRPLSSNMDAVVKLHKTRMPLYHETADAVIDNSNDIDQTADCILRSFNEYSRH